MDIDNERLTWIRCYGIPIHAWNVEFFTKLSEYVGVYLNSDDNTENKRSLDVARLLVRTQATENVNRVVQVLINNIKFNIKVVEDWCGPLVWTKADPKAPCDDSSSSSDDDFIESYFSGR